LLTRLIPNSSSLLSFPIPSSSAALYSSKMKTLFRTLLYLALIVWLGAEIFFPVVAAITFGVLPGSTHTAGTIVGELLRILHGMGIVSGLVLLALLALVPAWNIYNPRAVLLPMAMVVLMLACTAYSQYGIIPAMERDRAAAGGAIDTADSTNPTTIHFNMLHNRSVRVEAAILLLGIATVVLVARAESTRI
jgi:Domain of unknown function (DUF4149)